MTVASTAPGTQLPAGAFDELAAGYDRTFTDTALGRALRDLVWLRLDDAFVSGNRVLDLGCGTGADALRLARRGVRVVGIDASPEMVRAAQQKALAAGCAAQIDFHCMVMENLSTALDDQSFDGVLSNFGAVNCVRDLSSLIAAVAARLAPGGRLLWVVMGRYVPWEWLWYALRADLRKAWRRLPRGGARWRELSICYPTPAEMSRLLSPWFAVNRVSPLGFALPPSHAGPWLERSPRALASLRRLESALRDCSALASFSDHYIIEATRSAWRPAGDAPRAPAVHTRTDSASARGLEPLQPSIKRPLVSIILPTFGRLKYLRATVDSVYRQTLNDWELIIADDGSDAETQAYLRTLASDSRVKLLGLTHTGVPATVRNAALGAARGEYIAFLDSDDLWAPEKLTRQVATLRARTACGWSYTSVSHIDGSGRPLSEPVFGAWVPCEGAIFERLVAGPATIRTPSVLATRELIAQSGGFDEAIRSGEDYDLWLRLSLASEVALLDEPLVQVRRHEANHSRDWELAFAGRDHSLSKLQGRVDDRRRALLRAERIRNAMTRSATHSSLGNHGRAFNALCRAWPYSWSSPSWWLALVKVPLRAYVPQRLVEAYRRSRRVPAS